MDRRSPAFSIFYCLISFTFSAVFLGSKPVFAAITPGSIGISGYANPETDGATTATIYAGFADTGGLCASGGDGTNTCDSCSGLTVTPCDTSFPSGIACSKNNVYGALALYITFSSNDAAKVKTGTSVVKATMDSSSLDSLLDSTGTTASASLTANSTVTAKILWSSIFSSLNGSSSTSSFKKSFKIGISSDGSTLASADDQFTVTINYRYVASGTTQTPDPTAFHTACPSAIAVSGEGVCGFNVIAGDQKVFIKDVYVPQSTWPNPGDFSTAGVPFTGVRFFYAPKNTSSTKFCELNLSTAGTADLAIDSNSNLPRNKIFNLTNDQQYVFLAATVDKAGIVSRFSSLAYLTDETKASHSATPSEVAGLLDNKKCFIATAAFGSEMAPQVEWIRQFRNQFLLPHGWGRFFVRTYYTYSPPVAQFIAEHEWLRVLVRTMLWPLVIFSSLTVTYGFISVLLGSVISLSALLFAFMKLRQRRLLENHS